jgi:hypothetical protein
MSRSSSETIVSGAVTTSTVSAAVTTANTTKSSNLKKTTAAMFGSRYGSAVNTAASNNSNNSNNSTSQRPKKIPKLDESIVSSIAENNQSLRNTHILPAVIRMHLIQSLTQLSKAGFELALSIMTEETVHREFAEILTAMSAVFASEVWSIRQAILGYLKVNIEHVSVSLSHFQVYVNVFVTACREPKYSQIRVASLQSLQAALRGVNKQYFLEDTVSVEAIRQALSQLSVDSQANVLEALSTVQIQFLQIHVKK